jgi:hypothetical protein
VAVSKDGLQYRFVIPGTRPAFPARRPAIAASSREFIEPCQPGLNAEIRTALRKASVGWSAVYRS